MQPVRIDIAREATRKRSFAWAVDWPGWCRAGEDPSLAHGALLAATGRFAVVAAEAGEPFPAAVDALDLRLVESVEGGSGTDFGVPSAITDLDRRPTTATEAERLVRLVRTAWVVFDRTAAAAPAELRKGPRGGGRDRDKIVDHVLGADHAYCRVLGIKVAAPDPSRPATVELMRAAMLDAIRRPSDGTPIGGRKWPARYAARRIAWHALDHAWEMEDRTDPG